MAWDQLLLERQAVGHLPLHPPAQVTGSKTQIPSANSLVKPTKLPQFKTVKGLELLSAPDNAIIPSRLSQTTNKNGGKECGEFVNDVVGSKIMGNTIEDKLAVAEETTGKQGSVAVWTPNPNNKTFAKYGHTGIIMGDAGDNWIIRSSNLSGDGRITTDYVPKSAIQGYKSTNLTA